MPIPDLQEAIDLIEGGSAEDAIALLTEWSRQMPTYAAVHAVLARAHEAESALALVEPAASRAHVALDAAVLESLPVTGRDHRSRRLHLTWPRSGRSLCRPHTSGG